MKNLNELMNMRGRVALVTGGAGHIGKAMCEALAELGATILVLDFDADKIQDTVAMLSSRFDGGAQPLLVDLADEVQLRQLPQRIADYTDQLDVLVHCAALVGTTPLKGWAVEFLEQNADTWRKALEVNLTAPFILTQLCTPLLKASGHGSVITIASIYGVVGPQNALYEGTKMGNPAAYAASKGALIQFTRWLATVLAPDIRANSISVGGVWRQQDERFHQRYIERTPLQRMATEEDLKGAVAYLASDLSAYVTGHNLMVDGGWTAW